MPTAAPAPTTTGRFGVPISLKRADDAGSVEAVFSTSTVIDHHGDRVLSTAFKDGQAVPMVWSHDLDRPVGRGVVRVEPKQAVFVGRFFLETAPARMPTAPSRRSPNFSSGRSASSSARRNVEIRVRR